MRVLALASKIPGCKAPEDWRLRNKVPSAAKQAAEKGRKELSVEAPAFMRGKERFSAPGSSTLIMTRFSAGIGKSRAKAHLKINRFPPD